MTSISPNSALDSGGAEAVLIGTEFYSIPGLNYTVQLGDSELTNATYVNSTALTFTIPPSSQGSGLQNITVYLNGSVYAVSTFGLLYYGMNSFFFQVDLISNSRFYFEF